MTCHIMTKTWRIAAVAACALLLAAGVARADWHHDRHHHDWHRHPVWTGGYYPAPPVIYGPPVVTEYVPPPVVYNPGLTISTPGLSVNIH